MSDFNGIKQVSLIGKIEQFVFAPKADITINRYLPRKKGFTFNCPATLLFVSVVFLVHLAYQTDFRSKIDAYFALAANFRWGNVEDIASLFLYMFGDGGRWSHISYPMMLIVLIGPIMEERIGAVQLATAAIFTSVVTGALYVLLFNDRMFGPTSVAYMLVFLASFVNVRKGEIPLSFILVLVVVLFIGAEQWTQDFKRAFPMISGSLLGWFWATMVRRVRDVDDTRASDRTSAAPARVESRSPVT